MKIFYSYIKQDDDLITHCTYNTLNRENFTNVGFGTKDEVILKDYSLLDIYISQRVLKNKITIFANFINILNKDYQELYGYSTKGRNIIIGFSLKL